jgi:hypothetical protein
VGELSPFMAVLATIEQSSLGVWVRESPSLLGFPGILYLHTLGLAMLAGLSVGIDVCLIGGRPGLASAAMTNVYRIMWLGFAINALSGIALLAAYPAKALTNWVFFTKLLLIMIAMWVLEGIKGELGASRAAGSIAVSSRARRLAVVSLFLWAGTILAGRLLAYTHSILLTSEAF